MTEAIGDVVVDHADGLHEGITNGGPHKIESPLFEIFAQSIGERRPGRNVRHGFSRVLNRDAIDKSPEIGIERAEDLRDGQGATGIADGRFNLEAVAHYPCVGE